MMFMRYRWRRFVNRYRRTIMRDYRERERETRKKRKRIMGGGTKRDSEAREGKKRRQRI